MPADAHRTQIVKGGALSFTDPSGFECYATCSPNDRARQDLPRVDRSYDFSNAFGELGHRQWLASLDRSLFMDAIARAYPHDAMQRRHAYLHRFGPDLPAQVSVPAKQPGDPGSGASTAGGAFSDDVITSDDPDEHLTRLTGHIRVSAVPNHGILITITGTLTLDHTVTRNQALAYLNAINEAWNTSEKYRGVRYAVRTSLKLDGRISMFNPRGTFHITDCGDRCGPSVAYGRASVLRGVLMRSGIELPGTEAHEFGHVLGLGHRTPGSLSIMNSYWDVSHRRVSGYDLYRLEQLYGQ